MSSTTNTGSNTSLGDFIQATPELSWLDDAACGSLPLEQLNMFFVEAGRTIAASTIAMCERCPVRRQCLAHADQHEIVSGYFGGVSPSARRARLQAATASSAVTPALLSASPD